MLNSLFLFGKSSFWAYFRLHVEMILHLSICVEKYSYWSSLYITLSDLRNRYFATKKVMCATKNVFRDNHCRHMYEMARHLDEL